MRRLIGKFDRVFMNSDGKKKKGDRASAQGVRPRTRAAAAKAQERSQMDAIMQSAAELSVCRFYDYKEYLNQLYLLAKKRLGQLSYLDFSERLGFSKSNVIWLVMTGRRKLTNGSVEKIADALNFSSVQKSFVRALVRYNNTTRAEDRESLFAKMMEIAAKDMPTSGQGRLIEYFQEWYHPIIRELTATEDFRSDPSWISGKLNVKVSPLRIRKSLALLEELGLIVFDEQLGRHQRTDIQVVPDGEFEAMTMIRYHQGTCLSARDSIAKVSAHEREFNSLTLSLSADGMEKVRAILRNACAAIMEVEHRDRGADLVFQANLQLFPVTKNSMEKKKQEPEKTK